MSEEKKVFVERKFPDGTIAYTVYEAEWEEMTQKEKEVLYAKARKDQESDRRHDKEIIMIRIASIVGVLMFLVSVIDLVKHWCC